jgi:signal transduction histidine kinase
MPTPEILHEVITKKLIKKLYDKDSTTKLDTKQISEVVEIIRNAISERTGGEINIPFNEKEMQDLW